MPACSTAQPSRPKALGKYLYVDDAKLFVRGVTYGAFRPDADGNEYHDLAQIERDFADMAANGFNAVRIPHTMPPRALLDIAQRHGLRVMVGLSAEQYVGYIMDGRGMREIAEMVRPKVRIVRRPSGAAVLRDRQRDPRAGGHAGWDARTRRALPRAGSTASSSEEDPAAWSPTSTIPTTEYLQLPFLDFVCFNVYLETPGPPGRVPRASAEHRRRPPAGDEPRSDWTACATARNGRPKSSTGRSARRSQAGCAGTFIFSWTDEWYRGGARRRRLGLRADDGRPAAEAGAGGGAAGLRRRPVRHRPPVAAMSVVVCTYNGARTIRRLPRGAVAARVPAL